VRGAGYSTAIAVLVGTVLPVGVTISPDAIFLALAVPAFVSALFVLSLRWTEIETAGRHF
jgi:hypothetical protein